jgi:hypothetical protein
MANPIISNLSSGDSVKFQIKFSLFGTSQSQIFQIKVPNWPKSMANVSPKITNSPSDKEIYGGTNNYGITSYRIVNPAGTPVNKFILVTRLNAKPSTISKGDRVTFTTSAGDGLLALNNNVGIVKNVDIATKIIQIEVSKTGLSLGQDPSVNTSTNYITDTDVYVQGKECIVEITDEQVLNARNNTDTVKDILIFAYSQSDTKLQPSTTKYLMDSETNPPLSITETSPPSYAIADAQYSDELNPQVTRWINPKDGSFLYFFVAVARYTRYIKPDATFSDWSGEWLQKNADGTIIWTVPSGIGGQ